MSGLLGIVHLDGTPVDPRDLARVSEASSSRGVDGRASWIDGCAAIGHQYCRVTPESLTERQPFVLSDVVVSFDGRLDNRDEVLERCGSGVAAGGPAVSDAALVFSAYRSCGDRGAGRLVGDFAFALFDAAERRLLLARDIMAARSLYYAPLRHGILFASDIKSLLAHPEITARPDADGLADLVLNGYCDGHRTWFDGIWSVPPGAVVAATPSGLSVTRAWDFDDTEIRYPSFSEYAEHFRVLFTQAVKRRLRSAYPVAVSVSGGVDSSSIQCEASRLCGTVPVRGLTLAYPRGTAADEHEFIDVLRARGLEVDEVPVERVQWLAGVDQSVARTEMPSLLWDTQDALLGRARESGCRVVLDGFFADQLLAGQSYLVDLARRGRWGTVRRHLGERRCWMADVDPRFFRRQFLSDAVRAAAPTQVLRAARRTVGRARAARRYPPWFTKTFRERAFQRALDRLRRPRTFASEHAQECWRRATSGHYLRAVLQTGNAGVEHHVETAYPYRDRDLVAFLIAIPGEVASHDGVPKALLRRATEGVLPDAIRLRRTKGDGTALSNQAALAAEEAIRQWLGPRSLSARAGFLDAKTLSSQMGTMFGGRLDRDDSAELGWQLGDTLALELWLERFCRNGAWS